MSPLDPINPDLEGAGPFVPPSQNGDRALSFQIVERVRAHGQISRMDLARRLDVSPGSITPAVADLIDEGVLVESVSDSHLGRGRPPVALSIARRFGLVAVMKISDSSHTAVLVDFAGTQIAQARSTRQTAGLVGDDLVEEVRALFAKLIANAGVDISAVRAVGLGVPGFVEAKTGNLLWSPLLSAGPLELQSAVTEALGVPTFVDNDANVLTMAELWFGAGREMADFVVVTIEHGVGMGLVLGHRIFRGARGLGTELGHTKVQLDGALCRCGQRGCLEAYVSDYALVREASTALNLPGLESRTSQVMLESLFDNAKAGHLPSRAIFARAGRYLALGLANIVNLFDPGLIILSGERMRYDYLYAEEVFQEMNAQMLQLDRPAPKIEIRAWGDLIWARGAAALALSESTDVLLAHNA
ncbi:MAG: ROK family transcriptional regulator [Pseudomonadota bacterium]